MGDNNAGKRGSDENLEGNHGNSSKRDVLVMR